MILKPGKPIDEGTSYRPISLLAPAAKILERLILPFLNADLPTHSTQHGFRPQRSCTTALLPIAQRVVEGFNDKKPPRRTGLVAVDFSKAFHTVDVTPLLSKITTTNLNPCIKRWLAAYLRGRKARVQYEGATSPCRTLHAGVPQGSCISPVLFNYYVSYCPQSADITTSFADDFSLLESASSPAELETRLTAALDDIGAWADEAKLTVSSSKTTVTLFTSNPHEVNAHDPIVHLGQTRLPVDRAPKILGVTFDPAFSFAKHVAAIETKAKKRL